MSSSPTVETQSERFDDVLNAFDKMNFQFFERKLAF